DYLFHYTLSTLICITHIIFYSLITTSLNIPLECLLKRSVNLRFLRYGLLKTVIKSGLDLIIKLIGEKSGYILTITKNPPAILQILNLINSSPLKPKLSLVNFQHTFSIIKDTLLYFIIPIAFTVVLLTQPLTGAHVLIHLYSIILFLLILQYILTLLS